MKFQILKVILKWFQRCSALKQICVFNRYFWRKLPQYRQTDLNLISEFWSFLPSGVDAVSENNEKDETFFFKGKLLLYILGLACPYSVFDSKKTSEFSSSIFLKNWTRKEHAYDSLKQPLLFLELCSSLLQLQGTFLERYSCFKELQAGAKCMASSSPKYLFGVRSKLL